MFKIKGIMAGQAMAAGQSQDFRAGSLGSKGNAQLRQCLKSVSGFPDFRALSAFCDRQNVTQLDPKQQRGGEVIMLPGKFGQVVSGFVRHQPGRDGRCTGDQGQRRPASRALGISSVVQSKFSLSRNARNALI